MTGAARPVCNFNEDDHICNLKAVSLPLQCPPFTFYVIAYNKVGASKPSGHISAGMLKLHLVSL